MSRYTVARLEDIPEMDDGRSAYRPVRHHLGITTFGVTAFTGTTAGDRIINEHDEQDAMHELYLVLSGSARFELDGDTVQAEAGTFVSVPPGVMRTAFADTAGTTILAIGGGREGEPYTAGGWELYAPLMPLYEAGRHEELVERAQPLLSETPAYPEVFYNVACSEALIGRTADAMDHLRRSVELAPRVRDFARDDDDLAALRELPEFQALLAG